MWELIIFWFNITLRNLINRYLMFQVIILTVFYVPTHAFDPEDYPWRVDGQMVLVNNRYDITLSFDELYDRFKIGDVREINNYSNMYAYAVKETIYPEGDKHTLGEVTFMRLFYDVENGNLIYQWTFYDDFDSVELENDVKAFHEYFGLEKE
jgi:hypothetical protein